MANLQHILEDLGFETMSYSGRGMYGKTCLAIRTESNINLFNLGAEVAQSTLDEDEFVESYPDIFHPKMDSFGLGIVVYWPNIEYIKDATEN